MDDQEKLITAYHEGGHALVAAALPGNDPVHKITILPRGRALGYTMVLPDQDKYSTRRSEMLNQLAYMLGGRAAEELVFHDPTTGAANDIEKATAVARAMVTQYGMTERLGAIRYGKEDGEIFLGRDMGHTRDYSEEIAAAIDDEVRSLIDQAHNEAFEILVDNRDVLDALVLALLEKETLNKEQVADVFGPLHLRPKRPAWTGSDRRAPSDRPPVDPPVRVGEPITAGIAGAYGTPAPPPAFPPPAQPGAPYPSGPPADPYQPQPHPSGPYGGPADPYGGAPPPPSPGATVIRFRRTRRRAIPGQASRSVRAGVRTRTAAARTTVAAPVLMRARRDRASRARATRTARTRSLRSDRARSGDRGGGGALLCGPGARRGGGA